MIFLDKFISKDSVYVDLVDYLISKGFTVVKSGHSYKVKTSGNRSGDLSSLSIFPNRQSWKRWSDGTHGGDVIEFLRIVYGMTFQEAVKELGGGNLIHVDDVPVDDTVCHSSGLVLPERNRNNSRLCAYLIRTRYIDSEIVFSLMRNGFIYEDVRHNVVFLGHDDVGCVRFACVRGTCSDVSFRKDLYGSDKRFSFSLTGTDKTKLYVFESPIDLLSAGTLANRVVGSPEAWLKSSRLSLSGVSDVALRHYLSTHKEVKELHFWLDNDEPGRKASYALCRKYSELGFITLNHCPRNKDFNDDLIEYIRNK